MPSLLNKLRMLDAEPKKPAASPPAAASHSSFHHTQALFPISLFSDQSHATPELLKTVFGCPFPEKVEPEDVLFLDTETTGLSGGVGTVAFQIGVGYFTHSGFVVEQYLIHDYPEEAAMLQTLNALMQRFTVLCTFNGRTFDVPLLKSRFLMNRIAHPNFPEAHADVLYPARRLWKLRLKSCTLGHLEEQLLQVHREDDLPGALVPQTYFQYLKDGNFDPLQSFLDHNKQDIVTTNRINGFFKRICDNAGVLYNGHHALRHTFATRCIESNIQPVVLKTWLGHTDIHIALDFYSDVFDGQNHDPISKFNNHLEAM